MLVFEVMDLIRDFKNNNFEEEMEMRIREAEGKVIECINVYREDLEEEGITNNQGYLMGLVDELNALPFKKIKLVAELIFPTSGPHYGILCKYELKSQ